jgi:hypothetical protein
MGSHGLSSIWLDLRVRSWGPLARPHRPPGPHVALGTPRAALVLSVARNFSKPYNPHHTVLSGGGQMEGNRFGRLVVVELHSKDRNYNKRWLCRCDCGATTVVLGDKLKSGNTKSCGCLQLEVRAALEATADAERRLYTKKSYQAMVGRCTNPTYPNYARYGGSGIPVCDRWLRGDGQKSGWLCFFQDMGPKPTGHSIDRLDPEKGYSPDNCRWATQAQQIASRRPWGSVNGKKPVG